MIKITKKDDKAWVTFSMTPEGDEKFEICGEWNDWVHEPMKLKKSGEYYITKILSTDAQYQFGYRINNSEWRCDDECELIASPFGSSNSLLKI